MATRVNFNVFRFGKTIKWNFSAPSTNYNRLIRASYVFNKWCPIILKHFDITALRFVFSIESLEAHIIFIGYRRISRQQTFDGYFAGCAFHSKYNDFQGMLLPPVPRVLDSFCYWDYVKYQPVPMGRLLVPVSTPYHLVKKALDQKYRSDFSPIFTSSLQDNIVQAGLFKFFEVLCSFKSPFYKKDLKIINNIKRWQIRKRMRAKLTKMLLQGDLIKNPATRHLLTQIISEPLPVKVRRAQFFGKRLTPADLQLFLFSSVHGASKIIGELKSKINHCSSVIKQIKRLRRSYRANRAFYVEERKRKQANFYRELINRANTRLAGIKRLKSNLARKCAYELRLILMHRKHAKVLKSVVSTYTKAFTLGNFLSKTRSTTSLANSFFFEDFFKRIKDNGLFLDDDLAKLFTPNLFSNINHKVYYRSVLKRHLRLAMSKKIKSKLLSTRVKGRRGKNLYTLPNLKLAMLFLTSSRDSALMQTTRSAHLTIRRRRGHPFVYNYELLQAPDALLGLLNLISLMKTIARKWVAALKKKTSVKLEPRRRRFVRRFSRIVKLIRKFHKWFLISPFYVFFFSQLRGGFFRVLRTDKHLFNLFSNFVALVNKFRGARRLAVGPVAETAFSLRNFPITRKARPFLPQKPGEKRDLRRFVPNWTFSQFKEATRKYFLTFLSDYDMLRFPFIKMRFFYDACDIIIDNVERVEPRVISLFSNSFGLLNLESYIAAGIVKQRVFDKFPIDPYIDDVKEALSLDFLPSFDEKKTELEDDEYRTSLLFSKPAAFLSELPLVEDDIDPLNLAQLKYIVSFMLKGLSDISAIASDEDFSYPAPSRLHSTTTLPGFIAFGISRHVSFLKILYSHLRLLVKLYPEDKWSSELDDDEAGWPVINKIVKFFVPIYNFYSLVKKSSWDSYKSSGTIAFPLVKKNIILYNRIFSDSIVMKFSRRFSPSSGILVDNYYNFFNYYSSEADTFTLNWFFHPASSASRLELRDYDLFSYKLVFQKNTSRHLFYSITGDEIYRDDGFNSASFETYSVEKDDDLRPISKLSGVSRLFNIVSRDEPYFHRFRSYCPVHYFNDSLESIDFLKIQRFEDILFSSSNFALRFLGDRRSREFEVTSDLSDVFLNWIIKIASRRVIFAESSVIVPSTIYKRYILSAIGGSSLRRSYTKYMFQDSLFLKYTQKKVTLDTAVGKRTFAERKLYTAEVYSLLTYMSLLLMRDLRGFFVQQLTHFVFGVRHNPADKPDERKARWLTSTSSPYSDVYMTSHLNILNDLTRTFYNIFKIPIFVKYFPLPVFFSSSPDLSKFASKALSEVSGRGAKMNSHTRDWYLEYLFVCYASLVTKNAEGIVNFMIRILPYYKKWGDPVSLLLSPIAAADLDSMGISTVKISFRGRPSGVERARAINYVYGAVKDPAMRKLYTAGSYCYKQCISRKNGGVTSIHIWILSRV